MTGVMTAIVVAGAAIAAPIVRNDGVDMAHRSAITKVHGCHYDDRYSPGIGLHNHSNAECRAEPARPRERDYEPRRGGRGGYGGYGGYGGGHPCHFDCRFSPEFGWHNHSNAQCRPEPCRGR